MSQLIDQNDIFFLKWEEQAMPSPQKSKVINQRIQTADEEVDWSRIVGLRQRLDYFKYIQVEERLEVTLMHDWTVVGYSIFQELIWNRRNKTWKNSIRFIHNGGTYLKICSVDKILYLFKQLLKRRIWHVLPPFKLIIDPKNGTIRIKLTEIIFSQGGQRFPLPKDITGQLNFIIATTTYLLKTHCRALEEIQRVCSSAPSRMRPKLPFNLQKYMDKFGVNLSLSAEDDAENQVMISQEVQKQSMMEILSKQVILTAFQRRMLQLYVECDQSWSNPLNEDDLSLSYHEKQDIRQCIRVPMRRKTANIYDNNYILNCIKIDNPGQIMMYPISSGGFCDIYMGSVSFWYVYSGCNNQVVANNQNFTIDKRQMKMMTMKCKRRKQGRDRIEHQKNILKQIKGGNDYFIPKYYISTEENCFKDCLFSDKVEPPMLNQFVASHKSSLSLASKVQIIYFLLLGVRYLKLFSIVHLDLKPNNIMFSQKRQLKIIDFGESYHPNICTTKYAPGFTMPYSSPESFEPSESFSEKNDIFSIGVIAYEIINGRLPFYLYNEETQRQIYKYREYTNHWFYTPEQVWSYGDNEVFPFLQLIFGRCLDPDPANRPHLDWLCLILRECAEFYQI